MVIQDIRIIPQISDIILYGALTENTQTTAKSSLLPLKGLPKIDYRNFLNFENVNPQLPIKYSF